MARYEYDEKKVGLAIDELFRSTDALNNTSTDIEKGISMITSARGAEYLKIDFSTLRSYDTLVVDRIEELVDMIRSKAQEIEDFNSAGFFTKLFSSIGMGITKLGEGIATAGEQIVDGFASLTGMVVGIFSDDAKESIGDFIEKDHVGDFFYEQYENGALSDINKYSYFSHESTAANVLKGIGVAAGYVGLALATGGIGGAVSGTGFTAGATAAANSIGLNAAIAGVGGLGSGTQSGLQSGASYDKAFVQGVTQGAVQAGTVFAVGKLANKFSSRTTPTNNPARIATDTPKLPGSQQLGLPGPTQASNITNGVTKINGQTVFTSVGDDLTKAAGNVTDDIVKSAGSGLADDTTKWVGDVVDFNGNTVANNVASATEVSSTNLTKFQAGKEAIKSTTKNAINTFTSKAKSFGSSTVNAAKNVKSGFSNVASATIETIQNNPVAASMVAANILNESKAQQLKSDIRASNEPTTLVDMSHEPSLVPTINENGVLDTNASIGDNNVNNQQMDNNQVNDQQSNNSQINTNQNYNGVVGGGTDTSDNGTGSSSSYVVEDNNSIKFRVDDGSSSSIINGVGEVNNQQIITDDVSENINNTLDNNSSIDSDTTSSDLTVDNDSSSNDDLVTDNTTVDDNVNSSDEPVVDNNLNVDNSTIQNTVQNANPVTPDNSYTQSQNISTNRPSYSSGNYSNFNADTNYVPGEDNLTTDASTAVEDSAVDTTDDLISADSTNKGKTYTKIPVSNEKIDTTSNSGSSVIPIIAGVGAAAAAGLGVKAYIDKKKNSDNGEDDPYENDSDITTDNWDYDDGSDIAETDTGSNYLDNDDDYSYGSEQTYEKYDARTNDELSDLQ